ncbi:hypothetical protein [Nocardia sp. NPDC051832]|uniref:hypothetical protein n=1 Tax=Nocardia sp. NPDC051832 TaxID=3155673 RepID=UPI00342010DF
MNTLVTTDVSVDVDPTAEYQPAHGYIYGLNNQYQGWMDAYILVRCGRDVRMALDIGHARALAAQLTAELANHDIATADYSVDLVKAVA